MNDSRYFFPPLQSGSPSPTHTHTLTHIMDVEQRAAYTLVIIPPPSDWPPFVAIKKNHMNPRIRRPPYPHITLVGKFSPGQLEKAKQCVQPVEPFDLAIEEFKIFENARNCTVYLDPVESSNTKDPHGSMKRIHDNLRGAGFKSGDFEAHIGVCFCDKLAEAKALVAKYQKDFPSIKFRVTHLYVMKRVGEEDPFEPWAAIPLKGQEQTPLQHNLVKK